MPSNYKANIKRCWKTEKDNGLIILIGQLKKEKKKCLPLLVHVERAQEYEVLSLKFANFECKA